MLILVLRGSPHRLPNSNSNQWLKETFLVFAIPKNVKQFNKSEMETLNWMSLQPCVPENTLLMFLNWTDWYRKPRLI
ncbi:hypothetical protein CMK22_04450 [Candidatus Poribacteria bacterium]|nr:hypothetical protein [Candidatus Poribacteria bacterium]